MLTKPITCGRCGSLFVVITPMGCHPRGHFCLASLQTGVFLCVCVCFGCLFPQPKERTSHQLGGPGCFQNSPLGRHLDQLGTCQTRGPPKFQGLIPHSFNILLFQKPGVVVLKGYLLKAQHAPTQLQVSWPPPSPARRATCSSCWAELGSVWMAWWIKAVGKTTPRQMHVFLDPGKCVLHVCLFYCLFAFGVFLWIIGYFRFSFLDPQRSNIPIRSAGRFARQTALMAAATRGRTDVVRVLLERRLDIFCLKEAGLPTPGNPSRVPCSRWGRKTTRWFVSK